MKSKTQLAIENGRTIYTNNVYDSISHNGKLLKISHNKKLGKEKIVKGRHKGKYIYSLSLEERKTCPTSCFHWKTCYGNNMPFAHRFTANENLLIKLQEEIKLLSEKHKEGILIRLHVVGDFYSVKYVKFWKKMLFKYSNISIFGYTARTPYSEIGKEIVNLRNKIWDRFSVRFSNSFEKLSANSQDLLGNKQGIICPEQLDKTKNCANCGLCWNNKVDNIIFKTH